MFFDPDNKDFDLRDNSPCVDVGDNSLPNLPTTDFECDPRIMDGNGDSIIRVDMGADEYSGSSLDSDLDGVPDSIDNCPVISNPDQADNDSDGVGDVYENCPFVSNSGQQDTDGDGIGDVCQVIAHDPELSTILMLGLGCTGWLLVV